MTIAVFSVEKPNQTATKYCMWETFKSVTAVVLVSSLVGGTDVTLTKSDQSLRTSWKFKLSEKTSEIGVV